MPFDKRKRQDLLAHCDELRDDDGVDPREFFKPASSRDKDQRKTGQLCQQVFETLSLVLASEFDDPRLHNLHVVSVTPAPNASQLLVTVACEGLDESLHAALLATLQSVMGRLRTEVTAAITRKRAPRLLFRIVGSCDPPEVPS